ncbi:MAG: SH3 domain-containing protein [Lachnospiraceae bacterium]|nr:SH3 domain-containing protein [Lachnospiraceae bacterium]
MLKEKLRKLAIAILKHSKIIFPIIIIAAVALTVSFALDASESREIEEVVSSSEEVEVESSHEEVINTEPPIVSLEKNETGEIYTLVATYYNAYALGDVDTIKSISNYMSETDEIKIKEMSEYIETYPLLEIYTKPGPIEGSCLAYVYFQMTVKDFTDVISGMETFYVCTKEDGTYYLNEGDVSEEELEYIREVNLQDDVVELYNRVNVECSETFLNNADLFYFIQEIVSDVQKSTGEALAAQVAATEEGSEGEVTDTPDGTEGAPSEGGESAPAQTSEPQVVYAKTTTTVNLRGSDSEQATKVSKVTKGTKVQVLEQRPNGWSKVIADGQEGFIKSEYLNIAETVDASQFIGKVTATTNVKVRSEATTDSDAIGVLVGGDSADLIALEGEWCKIAYDDQVGYVKAEYVSQ